MSEGQKQEVSGFSEASLPTPLPTPNAKLSPSAASSQDTAVPVEGLINDDVRGKILASHLYNELNHN